MNRYTDLTQLSWWTHSSAHSDAHAALRKDEHYLWMHTIYFSIALYLFFTIYAAYMLHSFSVIVLHIAFAGTGAILIGLSFALSGICHFFQSWDAKIVYRKYLGLSGYFFALVYTLGLFVVNPERYVYGLAGNIFAPDIILGAIAMSILTVMAVTSNTWAMQHIGAARWRKGMRMGYVAYALLVLRALYLDHALWAKWLMQPAGLPPLRLVLSVFALGVIALRLAVYMDAVWSQSSAKRVTA